MGNAVVGVIVVLLGVGCLIGGAILCWQSTVQATCNDWEQITGYIGYQCRKTDSSTCGGCGGSNGTLCTCYSTTPLCSPTICPLGLPPITVSAAYLAPGIVLLVLGIGACIGGVVVAAK